jgi:hypothetical protein
LPTVNLPVLHPTQIKVLQTKSRFKSLRCGRRWGKTNLFMTIASSVALRAGRTGWFTPSYKFQQEVWRETEALLDPVIRSSNKSEKVIELVTGGLIEFWTLDSKYAGRSRKYNVAILDEIAFADDSVEDTWNQAIEPTLADWKGSAIIGSTPNGVNPSNFFYKSQNDKKLGWSTFHFPTSDNPYIPPEEIERFRQNRAPPVFEQEFLANWVNWATTALFQREHLLHNGKPVAIPHNILYVFAVIDTTARGGLGRDGSAVTFFGYQDLPIPGQFQLTVLDWDVVEIQAFLLDGWIPSVINRLDDYARLTSARLGSIGIFIEDKAAGIVLLQQGTNHGWPVHPVDSKLTSLGKDARCLNASSYFVKNLIKITEPAYDKTVTFKNVSDNHLLSQMSEYRVNSHDKSREDDVLDTLIYGAALALGNGDGF